MSWGEIIFVMIFATVAVACLELSVFRKRKTMPERLLFEHMLRVTAAGYVCRVWRQAGVRHQVTNETLRRVAAELLTAGSSPVDVAGSLVEQDGVNSVEVIDASTGCGVCVHKDWP